MTNRLISFMIIVLVSLTLLLDTFTCFTNAIDLFTDHEQRQHQQDLNAVSAMLDTIDSSIYDKETNQLDHTTSRRTSQNTDTCTTSICDNNDSFSNILAPSTPPLSSSSSIDEYDNEDKGLFSNLMNRLTGFLSNNNNLFSRLMNGLFNAFQQNNNNNEDSKYTFPTSTIVTLLSKYNDKIKNLTNLINVEMETDATATPASNSNTDSTASNAINMIYNFSTTNMNALNTVLDSMLFEFKQQETMEMQTIGCYLLQFVTFLHNTTVPNIVTMSQILYTKSNNDNMNNMWNQYSSSSTSSATKTVSTSVDSMKMNKTTLASTQLRTTPIIRNNQCTDVTRSVTQQVGTERLNILGFLFGDSSSIGPIGHIIRIVALILIFPLSIVVSLLGGLLIIFVLIGNALSGPPEPDDDDLGYAGAFAAIILLAVFGAPILVILAIFSNIRGIFQDLLDPFIPEDSPPTTPPSAFPAKNKSSSLSLSQDVVSNVKHQLSMVLFDSPIQSILNVLQDATTYMNQNEDENDEMDCDIMIVSCRSDALLNTLPF